jgi:hypothetical protein
MCIREGEAQSSLDVMNVTETVRHKEKRNQS